MGERTKKPNRLKMTLSGGYDSALARRSFSSRSTTVTVVSATRSDRGDYADARAIPALESTDGGTPASRQVAYAMPLRSL